MDQEPKLRSVPAGGEPTRGPFARAEKTPPASRVPLVLGTALAIALVVLVWAYLALGSRIDALERETRTLRAAVAERDELIVAQRQRLDDVRGRLQELLQLMEQPVAGETAPPPPAKP